MVRHRQVPLVLVALLALLTLGFAVLALSMAPGSASLAVQNGTAETFGSPLGADPFTLNLTSSVSAGQGSGVITQVRLIEYQAPGRMVVYRTSAPKKKLGTLGAAAIDKVLSGYAAVTAGSTPWVRAGSRFTRTESLVVFSARVSQQPSAKGTVYETAVVRAGELVLVNLRVVVPPEATTGGQSAPGGVIGETFHLLRINRSTAPSSTS
jgi:hypothetical protein